MLDDDRPVGPQTAFLVGREFAHLHPGPDWSLHLALPAELAEAAVAAGWAEYHPLARTPDFPASLVLLYAPRHTGELEVVWSLLRSSHEFASQPAGHASP